MSYRVVVSRAAAKDLRRLGAKTRGRLRVAMSRLADDPHSRTLKLAGRNAYRARVGPYRILVEIDDTAREVRVARIRHRRDAYRR
jgi:mRNA interferase RelE/StbE